MASKRHIRKKACEWKRIYPTLDAAITASIGLRRRTGSKTNAYLVPSAGSSITVTRQAGQGKQ